MSKSKSESKSKDADDAPELNDAGLADTSDRPDDPYAAPEMNAAGFADDADAHTDPVQNNAAQERPEHAEIVYETGDYRVRKFGRAGRERFVLEQMHGPDRFTRIGDAHDNEKATVKAADEAAA